MYFTPFLITGNIPLIEELGSPPMCGSWKIGAPPTLSTGKSSQEQAALTPRPACADYVWKRSTWSCLHQPRPPSTRGARSTLAAGTGWASCWARSEEMLQFFSFWYGKWNACVFNLTLFYVPDDFGQHVHMKQSVANKQMWLDQMFCKKKVVPCVKRANTRNTNT